MMEDSYQWQSSASMPPYSSRNRMIKDNRRCKAELAAIKKQLDAKNENAVRLPEALRLRIPARTQMNRARYM